jgi:hypothetical protein
VADFKPQTRQNSIDGMGSEGLHMRNDNRNRKFVDNKESD